VVLHFNVLGPRIVDVVLHDVASSDVVQLSFDGEGDSNQFWK
jgi:hypothetical protein